MHRYTGSFQFFTSSESGNHDFPGRQAQPERLQGSGQGVVRVSHGATTPGRQSPQAGQQQEAEGVEDSLGNHNNAPTLHLGSVLSGSSYGARPSTGGHDRPEHRRASPGHALQECFS